MTQPIGYLISDATWNGTVIGWRQDLYDKLPWSDDEQNIAAAEGHEKYQRLDNERHERRQAKKGGGR